MTISNSPDITNLSVKVLWDLSGSSPIITLTNQSTGTGLGNCTWAFIATSPSGTYIHNGSIDSPDITGNWSSHNVLDSWPRPFNSIEFSGAPYVFIVTVKDSNGSIYTTGEQTAFICRPAGNTSLSKNFYGVASSNVSVKCNEARIFFQDTTYHSYKGSDGVAVASILRVIYPIDETATIPEPFAIASYSTALVPISYSSNNYQFFQQTIYDYDLGNNSFVRIKYQTIQTFAVWCNIDLEPLVCEYNNLIDSIQNGSCSDVNEANKKLSLISPKMTLVFIGIMQPLTGIDVPSLVEDIKNIGGFTCDCCNAATGILPTSSSIIDGYNFIVNKVCGDISGTVAVSGTNITFNLSDVSYVVSVANESPSQTTAFQVIPSITGCQKTYSIKIDGYQLATDILNIIKNDSTGVLVNLFNSIVNSSGSGNSMLIVDGKCVLSTTSLCDYTFLLSNIPVSGTSFAFLTSIAENATFFAFNQGNISALQAYINSLGFGTFAVSNPSSGNVLITSSNYNNLLGISYTVGAFTYSATMTKTCAGYVPKTANEVIQAIINYLCDISDAEIETSKDYVICYLDPTTKTQKTVTISSGAALTDFIIELLARGCDTINYILGLNAVTCQSLVSLFQPTVNIVEPTDIILGTKGGACAPIYPVELGTAILRLGVSDSNFMNALCTAISLCGAGLPCEPFTYFYLTVPYSSPTDDTMSIVVNFAHPSAILYTIRYARIDNTNTPIYTTISSVTTSPRVITGLADGQYIVGLTPIYSDGRNCTEVTQTTPICSGITSFSAVTGGSPTNEFIISYFAAATVPKVMVNIAYPNGGSSSTVYTNTGTNIIIPFPTSVYGDFSITMSPVCNQNTGFFGVATAPVILTVNSPGTAGSYILGNNSAIICSGTPVTLFTPSGFAIGQILYTDAALTTKQLGYSFVMSNGIIYSVNPSTGAVTGTVGACVNYTLSPSYNFSIQSVTGTGVPALPPTGVSGNQTGHHTAMSGSYLITLSGTVVTTTKLDVLVNGVVVSCTAVSAAGTFSAPISASEADIVVIAVDSGAC